MPERDPNAFEDAGPYDKIASKPEEASHVILPRDRDGCELNQIDDIQKAIFIEIPPKKGRIWR